VVRRVGLATRLHVVFLSQAIMRSFNFIVPRAKVVALSLVACFALSGCASIRRICANPADHACDPDMVLHSVSVDGQGHAVRVDRHAPGGTMSDEEYRAQIAHMLAVVDSNHHHRVLVRIHGGLNQLGSALRTSEHMTQRIMADPQAVGYPIFVNWESGIPSTYWEHITSISQGRRHPSVFRHTVGLAAYLVADVGRAATRAPIVWFFQAKNFVTGDPTNSRPSTGTEPSVARTESTLLEQGPRARARMSVRSRASFDADSMGASVPLDVWKGEYHRSASEATAYYLSSTLLTPLKMVGTFVVDGAGTPGWANMRRRVKTMFRTPSEFDDDVVPAGGVHPLAASGRARSPGDYRRPTGAVSILFDSLEARSRQDTAFRVTLVGHSMGALVASEMVRSHPDIRYANIVFMAAASSMRDFELSIMPYLASHEETQFYSLSLHPLAELREQTLKRFGPNGSLLEWIDAYLADPEAESDRTMGKYTNVVRGAHMIPDSIRAQVHIKAFGYQDGSGCGAEGRTPSHHGDFNNDEVPYWNPLLWKAGVPCPKAPERTAGRVEHSLW
jgi:pimeloyl-ACP methyl ester carboxylesterase